MLKKPASRERDSLVGPPCSRNPHDEAVVVRRAQLGTKPGHPLKEGNEQAWKDHLFSLAAALLDELFEHPAGKAAGWGSGQVPFLLAERAR